MFDFIDWTALKTFLSDNSAAVIASISGGFFGAYGAQFISARSSTFESVKNELNAASAAFVLTYSICNRYCVLKKQIVTPMVQRFSSVEKSHAVINASSSPLKIFEFQANYASIQDVTTPISALEAMLFEKVSIRGRGLALVPALASAAIELNASISGRNELIEEFREKRQDDKVILEKYLGLPNAKGDIDQRHPDLVRAVALQTNDCIYFSYLLNADLSAYAGSLRNRYRWRYLRRFPKVGTVDWTEAKQNGLIPPDEDYKDWTRGFRDTPSLFRRFIARVNASGPSEPPKRGAG